MMAEMKAHQYRNGLTTEYLSKDGSWVRIADMSDEQLKDAAKDTIEHAGVQNEMNRRRIKQESEGTE
jgi:hypothetical protein